MLVADAMTVEQAAARCAFPIKVKDGRKWTNYGPMANTYAEAKEVRDKLEKRGWTVRIRRVIWK